jgi:alpha-glucosidase (family GH31 glycosyl hydrolase)
MSYNIPATAIVLEQWADEATFYIFSDAQYTPKANGGVFNYSDFHFTGKWTDPRAAVKYVHDKGVKVTLWQVPLMKFQSPLIAQQSNDQQYATAQGYAVKDPTQKDGAYLIPNGSGWFDNSLLLDFTNAAAVNWWMKQRQYLMLPYEQGGVGIDAWKCDGGEMVWGSNSTVFSNGKTGDAMRNAYPGVYVKSYNDAIRAANPAGATFSRSGSTGAQQTGIYWAGDQDSSFTAFNEAVRAGLSAGLSGVSNWSWDLAGFSGSLPSAELYKRAVEMATFGSIMQFHSEKSDASLHQARTPWNIQQQDNDPTVIAHFARYANIRMNLLPYIYSEAKKASVTGTPLMQAMVLNYANDPEPKVLTMYDQYMFGDDLLVAPVLTQGQTVRWPYLPQGSWIDFFYGVRQKGGTWLSYNTNVDQIPVFVKSGSILPLNLNANYELGGTIGNNLNTYTNLTFRIYPDGNSSYLWYDDLSTGQQLPVTSSFAGTTETVTLPQIGAPSVTAQIFCTAPSGAVTYNTGSGDIGLTHYSTLDQFKSAANGWFYDDGQHLVYVKISGNPRSNTTLVLNGVNGI